MVRGAQAIFDCARIPALPDGRHHQRLRAGWRLRAGAGLPLSRRHQGRQFLDRTSRGDAGHPSGFRRHRARGAYRRRTHCDADDAHGQGVACRPGAACRLRRSAGISRRRRSRRLRACYARPEAAHGTAAGSHPVAATGAIPGAPPAHRPGAWPGEAGALPCALRHHRSVEPLRGARRARPMRPRRAPLPR